MPEARDHGEMSGTRADIAQRMHRLGWCLLVTCLSGRANPPDETGIALLAAPAALIGANELRRLAPLLDRGRARSYMEWASIACGGVVVAGALQFLPAAREPSSTVVGLLGSAVVSLYALGLASWTTSGDAGPRLARRLRISVVSWWVGVAAAVVAVAATSPKTDPYASGFTLNGHAVSGLLLLIITACGLISWWLLVGSHHVIKTTMRELAAEDDETSSLSTS
jgi:hypothetical protein